MEVFLTVTVIVAMIAIGVVLIELLNNQHNERIAAYRYGSPLPGRGGRDVKGEPEPPWPDERAVTSVHARAGASDHRHRRRHAQHHRTHLPRLSQLFHRHGHPHGRHHARSG